MGRGMPGMGGGGMIQQHSGPGAMGMGRGGMGEGGRGAGGDGESGRSVRRTDGPTGSDWVSV